VIFDASTGSFASIAVSTTRLPWPSMSWIERKPPCGIESIGHGISRSDDADSSLPKRSGRLATHSAQEGVRLTFCASRLLSRASAWELSQDCATNTASRPNTAATAIMMMVLLRTAYIPMSFLLLQDRRADLETSAVLNQ